MTQVNNSYNVNLPAGLQASALDNEDGNFDQKISASIWNDFAEEHGLETIAENTTIDVEAASDLIETYRQESLSKALGNVNLGGMPKTIEELKERLKPKFGLNISMPETIEDLKESFKPDNDAN